MSTNPIRRDVNLKIAFPGQRRVDVDVRRVIEDVNQDGDGVHGVFVQEVGSQFRESDIALYCSGGQAPYPISWCSSLGTRGARVGAP